jgi:pyruvate/2-oxoglutarate dehydrogenase complex dihydrolipoamide acyltransferase (E2) component
MPADIVIPRLSDSMEEGTILRWLKESGDEVERGQELVPPQAGILGVGAIVERPVVRDGEIATAHLLAEISLGYNRLRTCSSTPGGGAGCQGSAITR